MASNTLPDMNLPDKDLALWMLERLHESEDFLRMLREARIAGSRDMLDMPALVTPHKVRLAKLFQSDSEDDVATSASTAAKIEAVMKRDLLSSPEEFIEKALAAYIEKHPRGAEGLPNEWQSTIDAARAEIEGRTGGAFEKGFAASLARSAREELERMGEQAKSRERGGREN